MQLLIIYSLGDANEKCGVKPLCVPEATGHGAGGQALLKETTKATEKPSGKTKPSHRSRLWWLLRVALLRIKLLHEGRSPEEGHK